MKKKKIVHLLCEFIFACRGKNEHVDRKTIVFDILLYALSESAVYMDIFIAWPNREKWQ